MGKLTNEDLLKKQLEMLKTFLEKGVITKKQYEFEERVLKEKIKIDK